MPWLDVHMKRGRVVGILVTQAYAYRDRLKALGARWDAGLRAWRLPLGVDPSRLASEIPGMFITDAAAAWLQQTRDRAQHLRSLHFAGDAVVRHPHGLDPYQRVGVRFLADAGRAILADDVGLGKTAQAIRTAMEVGGQHVLVVAKKSLLHNWAVEVKRWAGADAATLTMQDTLPTPLPQFTITNYEVVVRRLEEFRDCPFDILIVDEAAAIKNRKAQRSKALHKLARDIPYVWLLTATPMPNRPDEIWSLLHCIRPEVYTSYWQFVEKHCNWGYNFFGGAEIYGVKDPDALASELAPMMLRRDKSLLGLPPVTHEAVWVQLEGEQRRIYRDLRSKFLVILDEERVVTAPSVLALLTRLRQVTCSPALVGGPDESAKTAALLELLEDLVPAHKVLVFTTFAEYVKLLLPRLKPFGAVSVTGDTPAAARAEAVRRLNEDPDCRVFLGTIQAAGEGLNLQAADVVVFVNKSWVPSENEIQAVGRAHRRGQDKPVHVISITATHTVDEYIEEVLQTKKAVTEAIGHLAGRLRGEFW